MIEFPAALTQVGGSQECTAQVCPLPRAAHSRWTEIIPERSKEGTVEKKSDCSTGLGTWVPTPSSHTTAGHGGAHLSPQVPDGRWTLEDPWDSLACQSRGISVL